MIKFGLIGFPLEHSFSKPFYDAKIRDEQLDARFDLYPLEDISGFQTLLKTEPLLKGLAVTIPHKKNIRSFLSDIHLEAEKIGAINCIRINGQKVEGYNTDVTGFEKSFKPLLKHHYRKALILGSGGAASAATYVLKKMNLEYLTVSSSGKGDIRYEDVNEDLVANNDIIINCTPLGMWPQIERYPSIPFHAISSKHLVYDMIYNPEETLLLQFAKQQGAVTKNGLEMLYLQAEENWRIWNL